MNRQTCEASPQADESRREDELAFGQKAAAWRALTVKPAMPEEAHMHEVLAENAVQEKDAVKAIRGVHSGADHLPHLVGRTSGCVSMWARVEIPSSQSHW